MEHAYNLSSTLRIWYRKNARTLPWRETQDPYLIWLSEIILQQTRVQQGLPYFEKFRTLFPDIQTFASAGEDAILKVWQGLGYYSRARNMVRTAQQVVRDYEGRFPPAFSELLQLPGIGAYTAAAIASFAFHQPIAVVDGNVKRVLSRMFAINLNEKGLQNLANEIMNPDFSSEHNQAMMELGATICTPQKPDCRNCPWFENCLSGPTNQWSEYPQKTKRSKQKIRHFHYFVPLFGGKTLIQQRKEGDIWQGLWEFPVMETNSKNLNDAKFEDFIKRVTNSPSNPGNHLATAQFKHVLTHQIIEASFHLWSFAEHWSPKSDAKIVEIEEIHIKFACSRLTEKYLQSRDFLNYVGQ